MFKAITFKGKSRPASTDNQMPVGIKDTDTPKSPDHISIFSGQHYKSAAKHCNKIQCYEVWYCEVEDEDGPDPRPEPRKIRKLHEAFGPNAKKVCDDFIAIWAEDKPVAQPPMCPADGKKSIKPETDPKIQPELF